VSGYTIEDLRRANARTWQHQSWTEPEMVIEEDGLPAGIAENVIVDDFIGPTVVTTEDVERLGYALADFKAELPNIIVMDPPRRKEQTDD